MSLTLNRVGGSGKGLKPQIHVTAPTGSMVTARMGDKVLNAEEKVVITPVTARLPDEYQEVEYIQSSGTQYVNTGLYPTTGYNVKITFERLAEDGTDALFGAKYATSNMYNLTIQGTNIKTFTNGNATNNIGSSATTITSNKKYAVEWDVTSGAQKLYIDGSVDATTSISTTAVSTQPAYLMAYNKLGTADDMARVKLYSATVSKSGELLRDYIPCYIKATGEAGLYDLVSQTFFSNDGTGTFEVGETIFYNIIESLGWDFVLPELGTWTVHSELDGSEYSEDVVVDRTKLYQVVIIYAYYLVRDGVLAEGITPTVTHSNYNTKYYGQVTYDPLHIARTGASWTVAAMPVDFSIYKKVTVSFSGTYTNYTEYSVFRIGYGSSSGLGTGLYEAAIVSGGMSDVVLDVSSITEQNSYLALGVYANTIFTNDSVTIKDIVFEA